MKKESFVDSLIKTATLLAVLAAGQVAVNYQSTLRVVDAFSGKRVSCADGVDALDSQYPFDAVVVPDSRARERLAGAAKAYWEGEAPRIILNNLLVMLVLRPVGFRLIMTNQDL